MNDDKQYPSLSFSARYQELALMGLFLQQNWFPKKSRSTSNRKALASRPQQKRQQQQQQQQEEEHRKVAITRLPFLTRTLSYHRINLPSKATTDTCENDNANSSRSNNNNNKVARRRFQTKLLSRYNEHRRNVIKDNGNPTASPTAVPSKRKRMDKRAGSSSVGVLNILEQIESAGSISRKNNNVHPSNHVKAKHFQPCIKPCKKFPPYSPFCQDKDDDGLLSNLSHVSCAVGGGGGGVGGAATTSTKNGKGLHDDSDTFSSLDAMPLSGSCASKRKWNPPFPYATAFGLFSNKVQNEHVSKCLALMEVQKKEEEERKEEEKSGLGYDKGHDTKNKDQDIVPLKTSQILAMWNQLKDFGEYWIMEARWDQLRYKYQKSVYEMARNEARMGCVIYSYYFYHYQHRQQQQQQQQTDDADDGPSELHVQLEKRMDRRCPFCSYNGRDDLGLLMHCKTVHGEDNESRGKVTFDAGVDGDRNLHVMVKGYCPTRIATTRDKEGEKVAYVQDDYYVNFVFARGYSSSELCRSLSHVLDEMLPCIPFVRLPAKFTTLLDPKTKKRKMRQLEQQIRLGDDRIHPQAPSQYITDDIVPIRQYYHSKTMQPKVNSQWDVDSDDESDGTWAHRIYECALQELDDVSPKEKIFMNKWNRFMDSHTIIADHVINTKCKEFLIKYHAFLIENELRDQFLLHLFNLWDNRLISSSGIAALMAEYDTYSKDEKNDATTVAPRCQNNMVFDGGSKSEDSSETSNIDSSMKDDTSDLSITSEHQVDKLPSRIDLMTRCSLDDNYIGISKKTRPDML